MGRTCSTDWGEKELIYLDLGLLVISGKAERKETSRKMKT
jgi:hypothetical protein